MKILIVGAGVIGTLYGHVLSEQNDVFHYVREAKFTALNGKAVSYDIIDERNSKNSQNTEGTYTYKCTPKADESFDLIIVPVKTIQLIETLRELIGQAPSANYLLFTLDWCFNEEIDSLFRKDQYIMGYAGGGGTFKENLLWGNVGDDIMLGAVHKEQQQLLSSTDALFRACRIIPKLQENPLHWLWVHNAGTAPFGAALAKYCNMSEFLNDKALLKTALRATKECYTI